MRITLKTSRTATELASGFKHQRGAKAPPQPKGKKMNCENCKKEFEPNDTIFTIDSNQEVCYDCAQAAAKKAIEEEREIEILDQNTEEHFLCIWCEDLFPKSELRKEVNMGYLCDTCIQAIHSRGERLTIEY